MFHPMLCNVDLSVRHPIPGINLGCSKPEIMVSEKTPEESDGLKAHMKTDIKLRNWVRINPVLTPVSHPFPH